MLFCGRNWPLGLTRNTKVFDSLFFFSSLFFNSITIYPDLGIYEFMVALNVGLMEPMTWFARG